MVRRWVSRATYKHEACACIGGLEARVKRTLAALHAVADELVADEALDRLSVRLLHRGVVRGRCAGRGQRRGDRDIDRLVDRRLALRPLLAAAPGRVAAAAALGREGEVPALAHARVEDRRPLVVARVPSQLPRRTGQRIIRARGAGRLFVDAIAVLGDAAADDEVDDMRRVGALART